MNRGYCQQRDGLYYFSFSLNFVIVNVKNKLPPFVQRRRLIPWTSLTPSSCRLNSIKRNITELSKNNKLCLEHVAPIIGIQQQQQQQQPITPIPPLLGIDRVDLQNLLQNNGLVDKDYRFKQLWSALYVEGASTISDISTWPKEKRKQLESSFNLDNAKIKVN